jgi:hypothetical protein
MTRVISEKFSKVLGEPVAMAQSESQRGSRVIREANVKPE